MKDFLLKNALLDKDTVTILVRDGKIAQITLDEIQVDLPVIDCGGKRIVPGLFDIHSHGCLGHDTMDGTAESMDAMCRYLFSQGITSWLPTTMTMSYEQIRQVTGSIPKAVEDAASVVGYHLEGPFLSSKYAGAQDPVWLKLPDSDFLASVSHAAMVTVAPELEGAMDMIKQTNAVVALGHSEADYDTAMNAFGVGAKCLTHTFNAMKPIHHRAPGMIGAALDAGGYVQLICDGIHIHPAVVRMLYRMFGAERMVLISDSMSATGLPDGQYELGGQDVFVKGGEARLADGTLAGSTVNLAQCVVRAMNFGIPPVDAYRMASETPAKLMGVKKGEIAVGYDAEFLLLDDAWQITRVIAAR